MNKNILHLNPKFDMEEMILTMLMAESKGDYFAVSITVPGCIHREIIINHPKNLSKKAKYYLDTYTKDGLHRHAKGIAIVNFNIGDTPAKAIESL